MPIQSIAFDLDDTLIDTTGLLAPKASEKAFQILIDAGLALNFAQCEQKRLELIKTMSHKEAFKLLAEQYGTPQTLNVLELANKAFYYPDIPATLPLLPQALENLQTLSKKYTLYLVTAGVREAQLAKVKALNIGHFFKKIFIVNSLKQEKKYHAFESIIKDEQIKPEDLLCIGNSLSSEIKDARQIGAIACYFEFGEDRGSVSTDPNLKPHYTTTNHKDLIHVCHL